MFLFFNSNHDLRSGWKFLLYVGAFLLLGYATALLLSIVYPYLGIPDVELAAIGVSVVIRLVPAVLALLFMVRFVDHVPLAVYGVAFHERWARDLAMGILVAMGLMAGLVVAGALVGGLEMRWNGFAFPIGAWLATIGILIMSAASEEVMFRGYPMQVLMKGIGAIPAMLAMSILFGVLHIFNPGASPLSTFNTIVAGFMLSLAYLKTRSLWFPYGLHVAWNVGLGPILGFAISGVDLPSLWTARLSGPDTIVGGQYGPEGGFLGTIIFICGAVAVRSLVGVHVSPQLRATIARNAVKVYAADL